MIYALKGKISGSGDSFIVLGTGNVDFRIFTTNRDVKAALKTDSEVKFFCYTYLRDERLELYGFLEEAAQRLFETLNTVAGVGPKTALGILDIDEAPNIMAAIIERRADLLTKAPGIGRKTAERIILELQGRIKLPESKTLTEKMTLDAEVEEALASLGYSRAQVRKALPEVQSSAKTLEGRLKDALKFLGRRR